MGDPPTRGLCSPACTQRGDRHLEQSSVLLEDQLSPSRRTVPGPTIDGHARSIAISPAYRGHPASPCGNCIDRRLSCEQLSKSASQPVWAYRTAKALGGRQWPRWPREHQHLHIRALRKVRIAYRNKAAVAIKQPDACTRDNEGNCKDHDGQYDQLGNVGDRQSN